MAQTTAKKGRSLGRKTPVSEFTHNRFILSVLVSRDFKLKYRRSVLGIAWSVLNPLLMMIVLAAVFSYMFRFDIENFPMYLILGTTLFTMMQNSTTDSMRSIIESAPLIKKVKVEKMLFPLEKVVFELLNFAISLIAVVIVMLWFRIMPTPNAFFLPLLMVYMLLFCTGLGLLLSTMAVFFRDMVHLWTVVCTAWTYATPLFYPLSLTPGWMQAAMPWNPMYQYVDYFRQILLYNITPSLETNLICFGMAAITFAVGLFVFRKTQSKFILYV
jgi:ABC-2 type transport system permease protein